MWWLLVSTLLLASLGIYLYPKIQRARQIYAVIQVALKDRSVEKVKKVHPKLVRSRDAQLKTISETLTELDTIQSSLRFRGTNPEVMRQSLDDD